MKEKNKNILNIVFYIGMLLVVVLCGILVQKCFGQKEVIYENWLHNGFEIEPKVGDTIDINISSITTLVYEPENKLNYFIYHDDDQNVWGAYIVIDDNTRDYILQCNPEDRISIVYRKLKTDLIYDR